VNFGAVLGEVVKLPRLALETDELPIAVTETTVAGEEEMNRRAALDLLPSENRRERNARERREVASRPSVGNRCAAPDPMIGQFEASANHRGL
jgi:hypothetical protein